MPDTTPEDQTLEALTPSEARKLLHALRDRLVDGVANVYAEHLKDAKHDLRQLAQRASDEERRELYSAAYALLDTGALTLLNGFRDSYRTGCDRALAALSSAEGDNWTANDELALVDATAFERDLAVARLTAKAQYACAQQLTALDRRVAALLGLRRLDSEGNPFAVKHLFTALVDAAEGGWAGTQLALVLLETFEHYTAEQLPDIYSALNQLLVERGVLPSLPVEVDAREQDLSRHDAEANPMGDVFARLAGGVGLGAGLGVGAADAPGGPADARMASLVLSQLIDGLTGLQRGQRGAAQLLGVDLDSADAGTSAPLRRLAASKQLQGLQPSDSITVELVAGLFDSMFSDAEVPKKLRAEIGKLQVPVLKVALMDKGFFSDQRHPARRLIDVIAAAVRGWSRTDEPLLFARIDDAVQRVLEGFDTDTAVFDRQIDAIEALLKDAEHAARGQVSELVQKLEQRDRKLVAEAVVEDQIKRRTADARLPAAVTGFIDEHWRDLLGRIYAKYGDAGADWRDALTTLDDLIWSVQPKPATEERLRLMQMLPGLLERLPAGLARLGRNQVWEPFLAELMPLHMRAIKQEAPPRADADRLGEPPDTAGDAHAGAGADAPAVFDIDTREQAPEQPEPPEEAVPWILNTDSVLMPDPGLDPGPDADPDAAAVGAVEPEADTVPGGGPKTEPAPVDPELAAARRVEIGDWLEVSSLSSGNLSLRASWRSHQSGLILFADRRGRNAQVLSVERLAAAIRQGSARLLSRDPLTDRAVARLLDRTARKDQLAASSEA